MIRFELSYLAIIFFIQRDAIMTEKRSFSPVAVEQTVSFSELYSQHFSPTAGAAHSLHQVQATPFKIFSLTKNDVNVSYTNSAKIQ